MTDKNTTTLLPEQQKHTRRIIIIMMASRATTTTTTTSSAFVGQKTRRALRETAKTTTTTKAARSAAVRVAAASAIGTPFSTWVLQQEMKDNIDNEHAIVLQSISVACKQIASLVQRAGLAGMTGLAGEQNVQGEDQKKLDVISNEVFCDTLRLSGRTGVIASEEEDVPVAVEETYAGNYVCVFDPLDGSSNIDAERLGPSGVCVCVCVRLNVFRISTPKRRQKSKRSASKTSANRARTWSPLVIACTPRLPSWSSPLGMACTVSPWTPPSASSSCRTKRSKSRNLGRFTHSTKVTTTCGPRD